jgi:hypothetical protein
MASHAFMEAGKEHQTEQSEVALNQFDAIVGANRAGNAIASSEHIEDEICTAVVPQAHVHERVAVKIVARRVLRREDQDATAGAPGRQKKTQGHPRPAAQHLIGHFLGSIWQGFEEHVAWRTGRITRH